MLQAVALLAEGNEAEVAVLGGHVHLVALLHQALVLQTVGYEVLDGDDVQPLALGELLQLGHACHGAVFIQYLDEAGCGLHAGQTCQVDSGLGVSGACQHAAVLGIERIDVTGAAEGFGPALGVGQGAYGGGAVVATHARGAALEFVDGHREGRAQHAGVVLHLVRQTELLAALYGDGGAQHAAAVAQHEVDVFGRNEFGCHDEVAFVFAVLVVDYDDELTVLEVLNGLFDGVEFECFHNVKRERVTPFIYIGGLGFVGEERRGWGRSGVGLFQLHFL